MAQQLLHAPSAHLEPLATIGEVDFELANEVSHTDVHSTLACRQRPMHC